MSAFSRVIHIPVGRRAYSYFSSRSGGGRYFNSAKPPKAAVVAGKAGVPTHPSSTKADPSVENKQSSGQCPSQPGNSASPSTTEPPAQPPVQHSASQSNGVGFNTSDDSSNGNVTSNDRDSSSSDSSPRQHIPTQIISAKDFKMHQFFSFHRPLLLISQPSSLFRALPSNLPLFNPLPPSEADIHKGVMHAISGFGEPKFGATASSDTYFADADAEAARHLTRALTMTKAAATVSWEGTLKTLGLDVSKEVERADLQRQFDKDWEDVMLDSTKRKRRKKMKKHK